MRFEYLYTAPVFFVLLGTPSAFGQTGNRLEQGLEKCRGLASAEARLKCYEGVPLSNAPAEQFLSPWRLVTTPTTEGAAVSVIRAADTARSDPDFAGFSIRCGKDGLEYILIIITPLPPRARPEVTVTVGANEVRLPVTLLPSGAALRLLNADALAAGPWQSQQELSIVIKSDDGVQHGVVSLAGFTQARQQISAACLPR